MLVETSTTLTTASPCNPQTPNPRMQQEFKDKVLVSADAPETHGPYIA